MKKHDTITYLCQLRVWSCVEQPRALAPFCAMPNLESLAADTEAALRTVWDDLGVSPSERAAYLARIGEDVAALYVGRVQAQEQRRSDCTVEIAVLLAKLESMQAAASEKVVVVRVGLGACVGRALLISWRRGSARW